jgi:threonine/homoserine/homoserine lactone efflux protein
MVESLEKRFRAEEYLFVYFVFFAVASDCIVPAKGKRSGRSGNDLRWSRAGRDPIAAGPGVFPEIKPTVLVANPKEFAPAENSALHRKMTPLHDWLIFCAAALGMVLSPGPNMMYLLSRSICQGRRAGFISLLGVVTGFLLHILCASAGLTAIFLTVPFAYTVLKYIGAAYLLWLAWQAVRPGGASPFAPRNLPPDSPVKLFRMGFLTNALNPKAAVFYLSIFPQFVHPENGHVFTQSLLLGVTQMTISFSVNFSIVMTAGTISAFFAARPLWLRTQRWIMGGMLGALALRLALEERK